MAIYHEDIADINLNGGSLHRSFKTVSIGSGDQNANRFGMRVHRDGEPVDLTGVTCQAVFQDPMENNIALTNHGTVSGNLAYVTLPQACYNYEGRFCLAIKLIGGGVTGTMRIVDGVINNTHTGGTVAPTGAVPTYQEVLAAYDDAIAAVEEVVKLRNAVDAKDKADSLVFNGGNAVDMNNITTGYRVKTSDGGLAGNANYFVTDYIPIRPGMLFIKNHTFDSSSYGTAFYDESKAFIAGTGVAGIYSKMTAPDGAAYVRTTFKTSETDAEAYVTYNILEDNNKTEEMIRKPVKSIAFTQGTINTSGATASSDTRVRSGFYEVTETPLYINLESGFKVGYRLYSSDTAESFISYGGFYTEDTFIPAKIGQYVRLVVAKDDDSNIQPAEINGYYPLVISTLDINTGKAFSIPNAESMQYNIESLNNMIDQVFGGKHYLWEIGYIPTTPSSVDKNDVRLTSEWRHCVIPCTPGQSFFINSVYCETWARPYTFIDNDGVVKAQRGKNSAQNMVITAPAGATFLVCNSKKNTTQNAWTCVLRDNVESTESEDDEILNKIQQLGRRRRVNKVFQTKPLVMLHFSDIHGDAGNLASIVNFYEKNKNLIADIIHTGDTVDDEFSDGIAFWTGVDGTEKIMNVIGNHDSNVKSGGTNNWYAKTEAECYETYIAPFVSNWGVTYTENHCYFYKDYATNNIRLICLDAMHMTEDQLEWFTEALAGAKTAGYHVIAASHMRGHWPHTPYSTGFDDTFLTSAASPSYSSSYKEYMNPEYSDAVQDFIEGGGKFCCWIGGHTHYDIFAKLDRHPDQLQINVGLSGIANANNSAAERIRGTKSQNLFNVMAVDTYSKIVKMIRVGADYNLMMQKKDTVCYDYENHELIV